jgi:hypothetical protein
MYTSTLRQASLCTLLYISPFVCLCVCVFFVCVCVCVVCVCVYCGGYLYLDAETGESLHTSIYITFFCIYHHHLCVCVCVFVCVCVVCVGVCTVEASTLRQVSLCILLYTSPFACVCVCVCVSFFCVCLCCMSVGVLWRLSIPRR